MHSRIRCDAQAAGIVADTLVQADLWGHQSHGVIHLFWYAERLKSGAVSGNAERLTDGGFGAIATMNGRGGVGSGGCAFGNVQGDRAV